jgi:hypothetical protein
MTESHKAWTRFLPQLGKDVCSTPVDEYDLNLIKRFFRSSPSGYWPSSKISSLDGSEFFLEINSRHGEDEPDYWIHKINDDLHLFESTKDTTGSLDGRVIFVYYLKYLGTNAFGRTDNLQIGNSSAYSSIWAAVFDFSRNSSAVLAGGEIRMRTAVSVYKDAVDNALPPTLANGKYCDGVENV